MKNYYLSFFLSIFFIMASQSSFATHIRAGEITAVRPLCQGFEYEITIIGYTDTRSPVEFAAGELDFGDGGSAVRLMDVFVDRERRMIDENVQLNKYVVRHTFPGNGSFRISYREQNRNGGVLNMDNSVNTPFYIETMLIIDPYLGCNNTPELLIPPIDKGAVGAIFMHNPGAYDAEGDSLSYKLVVNKQDRDLEVINYVYPNNPKFNGTTEVGGQAATFTLDPLIGNLVWNSPGQAGEYNIAFIIEEWRKVDGEWFSLGYVTRDMQVIVEETDNEKPELIVPQDTCIVAGNAINELIQAQDPDGDKVKIESFGGVYLLNSSPANFLPTPAVFKDSPTSSEFSWNTNCSHVRDRSYTVYFKATDKPPLGPSLVDFKTWNITVVGPAPEGLTAEAVANRTIDLAWDTYSCDNASIMQVWRRVGSFEFESACQPGVPENSGYQLVGEVPIGTTSFADNNNGEGLDAGATYCYRLVAVFPEPSNGESLASMEACVTMEADAPVILNVSVEKTGQTDGEIYVRWAPPLEIDQVLFPPAYSYELIRQEGMEGTGEEVVVMPRTEGVFEFTDTGLNTKDNAYRYTINLYDASNKIVKSSATASSVLLDIATSVEDLTLTWTANVPWSINIQDFPYHDIYRDQIEIVSAQDLVLMDSTNVTIERFKYIDDGSLFGPLDDDKEYCYYVVTRGTYGNENLGEYYPLINKSQILCAQPNDTVPPCPPIEITMKNLSLENCRSQILQLPCDYDEFTNVLEWEEEFSEGCKNDVRSYNVYYSPNPEEHPFQLLENIVGTSYEHANLTSMAGCYYLTSVDRSGNESVGSKIVCTDNCPNYQLPNVFTPNNDGANDLFNAFDTHQDRCPRFVESVQFRVYNRWGKEVYTFNSTEPGKSVAINWDGRNNSGKELSGGIYYYVADVKFLTIDPANSKKQIKGWIQLFRNRINDPVQITD